MQLSLKYYQTKHTPLFPTGCPKKRNTFKLLLNVCFRLHLIMLKLSIAYRVVARKAKKKNRRKIWKVLKKKSKPTKFCEEMCPQMFSNIWNVMDDQTWTWQQDGARAHKARALDQFIQQSTPDSIDLEDWLSKSSDLNMMDYCIWSMLLTELQSCQNDTHSIDDLKTSLGRVWNNILQVTISRKCYTSLDF